MEMALTMDHPIYDCVYLTLAEAHGSFVVTNDLTFRQIATRHGYAALFRDLPLPPDTL
jgi:predicted nucleic acid-binding protein